MKTQSGESRGFGFVNFKETDQAQAACTALNNFATDEGAAAGSAEVTATRRPWDTLYC